MAIQARLQGLIKSFISAIQFFGVSYVWRQKGTPQIHHFTLDDSKIDEMTPEEAMHWFIYHRGIIELGKKLSVQQEKIYNMLQEDKSYAEIAAAMDLHPSRIYTHITLIRTKGYLC